jgi:lipopolysaccharide biosynthesis glycosyltransferase
MKANAMDDGANVSTQASLCPIVMASDEGFAMPLATALLSLVEHNRQHWPIEVHVLNNGFSAQGRARVETSVPPGSLQLHWRLVDTAAFDHITLPPRLNVMMFARLYIPHLFSNTPAERQTLTPNAPTQPPRVLYLDADILVLGDLAGLCQAELGGAAIAAVPDWHVAADTAAGRWEDVAGLPAVQRYFNSGVLLIDIAACLKHQVSERALAFLQKHPDTRLHDQDALNVACDGLWKAMPAHWNFQAHHGIRIARLPPQERPAVAHFIMSAKPWKPQASSVNGSLHDAYRNRTQFRRSPWAQVMAVLNREGHRWFFRARRLLAMRPVSAPPTLRKS